MIDICKNWPITEKEYLALDKEFGSLCEYAAWQLYKRNSRNNHTDDQTDISQELKMALIRAGSYYKRQAYIESSLELCVKHSKTETAKNITDNLLYLWKNKTKHGANRQKFGPPEEEALNNLVEKIVPEDERPDKDAVLKMDSKFIAYCKAITWNAQKALGKKITREKAIRSNQVSISEFDYFA